MKKSLLKYALAHSRSKLIHHPWYRHRKCHFSYIVIDNQIKSFGMNRGGVPPLSYNDFSGVHSEVDAWNRLRADVRGKEIECINIRLNRSLQARMSHPCCHCQAFLSKHGCTKIWFTNELGIFEKF